MHETPWTIVDGEGPLVAISAHSGHQVRPDVARMLALDAIDRLREEDPFTDQWTTIAPTHIQVHRSRFEFDLNRPRPMAVYRTPEDAWGLRVWNAPLENAVIEASLVLYDRFYESLRKLLQARVDRYSRVVVFDLHSYNHQRLGPGQVFDDPALNPDINLGTGTVDRDRWSRLVDRFRTDLAGQWIAGRSLDVRENVRFFGGQIPRWIHATFPGSVCVLAIEVKKIFMDEWTGRLHEDAFQAIGRALAHAAAGLLDALDSMDSKR